MENLRWFCVILPTYSVARGHCPVWNRLLTIGNIADMTLWWSTLWSGRWEVFDMMPPGHTKQTYCHSSDHTQTDRLAVNTCGSGELCGLISRTKHLRRCCRLAVANCTTHVMSPMTLVLALSYHRARKPAGWGSVYRDSEFGIPIFPREFRGNGNGKCYRGIWWNGYQNSFAQISTVGYRLSGGQVWNCERCAFATNID